MIWAVLAGLLIWVIVVCLPSQPWRIREYFTADPKCNEDLSEITVLIPARNEQAYLGETLRALLAQDQQLKIIVIDDQSTDDTATIAKSILAPRLHILTGQALPDGWSGKLWALEQGRTVVATPLILLLDADIKLTPGTIAGLLQKKRRDKLQLISLMARLNMDMFWARILLPAFIYFFKLLYPFHAVNKKNTTKAAAAGGCILLDSAILTDIGGFAALKNALIDDCRLATLVKQQGGKIWLGLTHDAISLRNYNSLQSIWSMVTRTAFTQLHHSILALLACTMLMLCAFIFPLGGLLYPNELINCISLISIFCMLFSYRPTLQYYQLSPLWGLGIIAAGGLFLLMTWHSAKDYFYGHGPKWKERQYPKSSKHS